MGKSKSLVTIFVDFFSRSENRSLTNDDKSMQIPNGRRAFNNFLWSIELQNIHQKTKIDISSEKNYSRMTSRQVNYCWLWKTKMGKQN